MSPVVSIPLSYACLAALWILFSDSALGLIASGDDLLRLSVYKGLLFVAVTTLFLLWLVRSTYGALEAGYRELEAHQEEIRRLSQLNAVLSHVNQAIVRLPGREELCQRVCQILVEHGGFRLAWIGWLEPGGARLAPSAAAGEAADYVLTLRLDVEEGPAACGLSVRALHDRAPCVCNDLLVEPLVAPWRPVFGRHGLHAAVSLPIPYGAEIGGVLNVYADQPGVFHERELALLREAVADLAFGLENLEREARRREAEERRRLAEEAQHESEERFRATFEQAAVGIAHAAPDGCLLRVNDKLCAITGRSREELVGSSLATTLLPEDRAAAEAAIRSLLAAGRGDSTLECRCQLPRGGVVWVGLVTALLRDAADAPRYFISVVTDISERKRLEQQFLRAQRLESIGTLAGGIAHDLNNLLAPIVMGVELVRSQGLPPSLTGVVDNMERSARRGANLVRQVLSFARGVDGARVPLPLRHVIDEVGGIVESTFPKNIVWSAEVPRELWPVRGDATQLHQVLLNLCVNARDAMPEGGRLRLSARNVVLDSGEADPRRGEHPGPYVLLEVADEGCGMTPEVLDRIYEPFFTTKPPGLGTGLGLSTALGIVRAHGGRLDVQTELGRGCVFRLHLPAEPDGSARGSTVPQRARLVPGRGELVLVVDDESAIRDITRLTLESFGYRVLIAKDGAEAVALFAARRTDIAIVITDLLMPTMAGPELIAELRRLEPTLRVIGVSGQSSAGELPSASPESTAFLQKPFSAEALLALLRKLLDARPPRA